MVYSEDIIRNTTTDKTRIKKDKMAEEFMKFMTDLGATFVDVTPKKKKFNKK